LIANRHFLVRMLLYGEGLEFRFPPECCKEQRDYSPSLKASVNRATLPVRLFQSATVSAYLLRHGKPGSGLPVSLCAGYANHADRIFIVPPPLMVAPCPVANDRLAQQGAATQKRIDFRLQKTVSEAFLNEFCKPNSVQEGFLRHFAEQKILQDGSVHHFSEQKMMKDRFANIFRNANSFKIATSTIFRSRKWLTKA
jgi:hypothetical protein